MQISIRPPRQNISLRPYLLNALQGFSLISQKDTPPTRQFYPHNNANHIIQGAGYFIRGRMSSAVIFKAPEKQLTCRNQGMYKWPGGCLKETASFTLEVGG